MSKFEGNAVTWFEIPTADIQRATRFYETLLAAEMLPFPGDEPCQMFPVGKNAVGGCLVQRLQQKPGGGGTMVYLNVDGKLDDWTDAAWAEIDKRGTAAYFNSNSKPYDVTGAVAIAGTLLFLALLFFVMTMVRLGGHVAD